MIINAHSAQDAQSGVKMSILHLVDAARALSQIRRYGSAQTLVQYAFDKGITPNSLSPEVPTIDSDFARIVAPYALKQFSIESVQKWLGPISPVDVLSSRGFRDADFILWADINLNIVDGSSAWLVSMARILSLIGKTVVLSKADITRPQVVAPILEDARITILQPSDFDESGTPLTLERAVKIIAEIDDLCPRVRALVVRGVASVEALSADRRFQHRLVPYLTDVYEHSAASIRPKEGVSARIDAAIRQCRFPLFQTQSLQEYVRDLVGFDPAGFLLPPPIGDELFDKEKPEISPRRDQVVKIGYAGKIAPHWGIDELLDWTERLIASGHQIEVHIFGDKISTGTSAAESQRYRTAMNQRLNREHIYRHGALAREDVIRRMADMDFAWCWRPSSFEDATLELSSKLVEGIATGQRCIVWPSAINRAFLGENYPFFLHDESGLPDVISRRGTEISSSLTQRVREDCAISHQARRLAEAFGTEQPSKKKICILTHDAKFVFPWFSWLKSRGIPTLLDLNWDWGAPRHPGRSHRLMSEADVVFCEWGLGNAVWASEHIPKGKTLIVRLHAQEVRKRAVSLTKRVNSSRVDRFICVADWVRKSAIEQYSWSPKTMTWIPNYVQGDEYRLRAPVAKERISLGLVGILPQTKRIDRALDLLATLVDKGIDAELHIKGHRPADLPMMRGPSRRAELEWFDVQFARIDKDDRLKDRVHFHPWGNDVARFYSDIDVILSPSETESFHYALADGVLSGCFPVVWDWPQADRVYPNDWVIKSTELAVQRILEFARLSLSERDVINRSNRETLLVRYDRTTIYPRLLEMCGLTETEKTVP